MKERQAEIIIEPGRHRLLGIEGGSLYTLLLVAGLVDAGQPLTDRLRLEKGSISPAVDPEAESAVFSAAELAEGWLLASQRRLEGDAVLTLRLAIIEDAEHSYAPLAQGFGMAFDIGTATLAAGLVDLDTTRIPLLTAGRNSQLDLAAEPEQRRQFCCQHEDGAARLGALLKADIAALTEKLLAKAGISGEQVNAVTMAGSELMFSLLQGGLPLRGARESGVISIYTAADLSLGHFTPQTPVYLLPAAGRDIGANTVASSLAAGLLAKIEAQTITLLVDIGVRGEIIAAGRGRLLAAHVSSAPFEGVGISCGMQAVTGAITQVEISDTVILRTVRDGRPRGLCGAGLISAAHALLKLGVIDSEGHMLPPEDVPEEIAARFRGTAAGREFLLSRGDKAFPQDICINQADIRQLQMAKGAIYAACRALLAALKATDADIGEILLAEAYRANLSPPAVQALGMLPQVRDQQILSIGNASWQGAYLALSNRRYLQETEQAAAAIQRLDLTNDLVYAENFILGMNFPEI